MKFSKILLLGLAGAAIVVVARRIMDKRTRDAYDDHLEFDSDFIPGSKKYSVDIPDHINPSWFRVAKYQAEDTDPMFI